MSGPKGFNFELQERLRRQRELEALRRTWDRSMQHVSKLQHRLALEGLEFDALAALTAEGYGSVRREHPSEEDLEAVALFQSACARIEELANVERTRVILSLTRTLLHEQFEAIATDFKVTRMAVSRAPTKRPEDERVDEDARKSQELIELLAQVGSADRAPLTEKLAALNKRERKATSLEWLGLTREITDTVRRERDREKRDRIANDLDALIARIEGQAAADLRARVSAATTLSEIERLRPQIHVAVADTERVAEREFVVAQALEVWRELGYVADADFVAHTAAGRSGLLYRDGWPDHALQVRLGGDGVSLGTNIVAFGDTSALRDTEIEYESCAMIDTFQEALGERGLNTTLTRQTEAGKLAVQRLPAHQTRTSATSLKEAKSLDH